MAGLAVPEVAALATASAPSLSRVRSRFCAALREFALVATPQVALRRAAHDQHDFAEVAREVEREVSAQLPLAGENRPRAA